MDFVRKWSEKTEIAASGLIEWLKIGASKFYDWRLRYGKVNEHNAWIPRDHWLEDWEKKAIIDFHHENPLEGYRRLTFMMLDANVVAASPTSVWRVLGQAGLLQRWNGKPSLKGTGFQQPLKPHEHWHVDVSYINISGTFYYLCSVLDGASRYIAHWEIRESMKEQEVELILQRAHEKFPDAKPRVISDNGPQFVAKDFKEFIRICGMTHVPGRRLTIRSRMERSNGGTNRSKRNASGQECRYPWRMRSELSDHGSIDTIRFGSTARSVTLRRSTSWKVEKLKSSPSGIASWRKLASSGNSVANNHGPSHLASLRRLQ